MSPLVYPIWKYLRVCGEERIHCQHDLGGMEIPPRVRRRAICRAAPGDLPEIPPRVRRRVFMDFAVHHFDGNTSACAEKSGFTTDSEPATGKYLRVCGEERFTTRSGEIESEIPPRVRRRVANVVVHVNAAGNTSACAEKRLPILRLYYPDS